MKTVSNLRRAFAPVRTLFVLCLLGCLSTARTQPLASATPTQTIKGRVFDQASQQPIVAANVVVVGTEPLLGASTDHNGYFRIEGVPLGRHHLHISYLGYEDAAVRELLVGAGKEVDLQIGLVESLLQLDEVVVKATKPQGSPNNDMASLSARSFSVDQTKRYAAAVNDPARMALSFAGVSSNDDGGNEIIIRGNSPRGLLWRMEGIEIPNPNHFAEEGASGGGISALSVNVLSNSDFFTGAFPAEYGNATSGVFDLRLRNGNADKREYAIQAGFLGLDVAAEGPLGKPGGASYLANYRYSTLGILNRLGLEVTGDGVTDFQDAAFKIQTPTAGGGQLSLWGMGGLSVSTFKDTIEEWDFTSDRGVVGLNYRRPINENSYLETILSYSATRAAYDYTKPDEDLVYAENFVNSALRGSVLYNRKINARHTFRLGAVGHRLQYDLFTESDDAGEVERPVDQNGNTFFAQAYGQWKYRPHTHLTLNAGLHTSWLALAGQYSIEPRLGMRWNVAPGHTLSAGAGLHSRMESLALYLARVPAADQTTQPNQDLKLGKAAHLVAGYQWRFRENWQWQVEAYYQHLYHAPIGVAGATEPFLQTQSWLNAEAGFVADSLASAGLGRNYGLEITVEKFFTGGWYFLSATSLYRSRYTPRDGIERNSRFDGRFVQNMLWGKEWKVGKNGAHTLGLNFRGIWAGGSLNTPIDLEKSREEGRTERDWTRPYSQRNPNYFRLDTRLSYSRNRGATTSTFSLDLQNATNRLNAHSDYFDANTNTVKAYTQTGLIPVFNYRLEF